MSWAGETELEALGQRSFIVTHFLDKVYDKHSGDGSLCSSHLNIWMFLFCLVPGKRVLSTVNDRDEPSGLGMI